MSMLAMVAVLQWRWPRKNLFGCAITALIFLSVVTIFAHKEWLTREHLAAAFKWVQWVLPQGWAVQVAMWLAGERREFPVLAAGLLATLLAFAVPCFRTVRDRAEFPEVDSPALRGTDDLEESDLDEDGLAVARQPMAMSRSADVEQRVLERGFLRPPASLHGWIERIVLRLFPQRGEMLEFLIGPGANWSSMYFTGLKAMIAGPALAWLISHWSPMLSYYVCGFGLLLALVLTTPLFGGHWMGLEFCRVGGRRAAVHALLPVDVRAIRNTILTVSVLRFLLALPVWIAVALFLGHEAGISVLASVRIGAHCWLLALSMQPLILVFVFSQGTSDSNGGCLTQLLFVTGCGGALVAFIAGVSCIFVTTASGVSIGETVAVHAVTPLVLAAVTFGFEAIYRRLYARQRFDLLTAPGK
jgi:hypothetical protein